MPKDGKSRQAAAAAAVATSIAADADDDVEEDSFLPFRPFHALLLGCSIITYIADITLGKCSKN